MEIDMDGPYIYTEERTQQWVSDGLENDFQEWNHKHAVLISAQTGRGKNHFIMEKLIPHALKTGQQVFIFSNRVALSTQQKKLLLNKLSIPLTCAEIELRNTENFRNIIILSYQSALKYFEKPIIKEQLPLGGFPSLGHLGKGETP